MRRTLSQRRTSHYAVGPQRAGTRRAFTDTLSDLAWSPDGTTIAYVVFGDGDFEVYVYLQTRFSSEFRRLGAAG